MKMTFRALIVALFLSSFTFGSLSVRSQSTSSPTNGPQSTQRLPVEEIWTEKSYSDPNDRHLKFIKLDPLIYERLFSKLICQDCARKLWRADINNDGQQDYVFVQTLRKKTNGEDDGRSLDKLGPIFKYQNGKVTEIQVPIIPVEYTNILLPFLEYGSQGLQMNLHYNAGINTQGEVTGMGNEANSNRASFVLSRRVQLLWKDNSIKKLSERFICNEGVCSRSQMDLIKRAKLL